MLNAHARLIMLCNDLPAATGCERDDRRGSDDNDSHLYDVVAVRPQRATAQGGDRLEHWYRDRMVRLFYLWYGRRAHLGQALLPQRRPVDGYPCGIRHLFRRVCRPAYRRGDFRPLWRSHRPQGDPHRDPSVHGDCDLSDRIRADLRADRNLGCCHPDRFAESKGSAWAANGADRC
jgi:hypothetical protein